ncbi:MAG TPA: acetylxylan esterase, partial [Pirellulaceae bacterium]|nr:acetylxylan esterase [Pirellulaceae bacterium]
MEPLKDLDGYFPFTPAKSKEEWEPRAEQVRRQIFVANGLWPMPTKTPLNPQIHGLIDMGDYTVEKAFFESLPGFYVTGNLYRPKGKSGPERANKAPGVLCPHGHWPNGRFYDNSVAAVQREIESGAEQFESNGRSPLQARCVHLAKMGCVVFHYDMIGYADNTQISYEVAHRFAKQRPEMNT